MLTDSGTVFLNVAQRPPLCCPLLLNVHPKRGAAQREVAQAVQSIASSSSQPASPGLHHEAESGHGQAAMVCSHAAHACGYTGLVG